MREITALTDPEDPGPMLSTFDVLAEDIESLLADGLDPLVGTTKQLIVTRLAVPPGAAGSGPPLVLMESHDTGA